MASTSPQHDRDRAITKLRSQILRTTRKADRSRALVVELDEQSRDLSARSVRWVADEYRRFQEIIELRCLVAGQNVHVSGEERQECLELLRLGRVRGKENADVLRGVKELGERIAARTEDLGEELVESRKDAEGLRKSIHERETRSASLVNDLAQAKEAIECLRQARHRRATQLREAHRELDRFQREQETHDETERALRLELQQTWEVKRELDETTRTQAAQLKLGREEREGMWYELTTSRQVSQDKGQEVEVLRSRAEGAEERLLTLEVERLGLVGELEESWEARREMEGECEKLRVEVKSVGEEARSSRQEVIEVTEEKDRLAIELEKSRREIHAAECARGELSIELDESRQETRTVECARSKLRTELDESRRETHTAECARDKLSNDLDRANHTNTTPSSQLQHLTSENTKLKSASLAQEAQALKLEHEAETTKDTITTLRKQLANAQAELTKHQDIAVNLQRDLTASEDQCNRMDSTHDQAVCGLQELLDTASRERDSVRDAYAALSTELKQRQAKLVDAGRAIEQLSSDLDIANTKAGKAEVEVREMLERVQVLAKVSVGRAQRISELEPECWELRKRVEKGRQDEEAYRRSAVELSGKHDKTVAELKEMKCEFDHLESRAEQWLEERDENLSRLGEEKAELLARLSKETDARSDAEDAKRKLREQLEEANKAAAEQKADGEVKIAELGLELELATQDLLDARTDHDKTREELEQASKELTQSQPKIAAVAKELAVTIIDLERLRLEYNVFKKKEAEKILDLEAEVAQQKKCVRSEWEKVCSIKVHLANRDRRIFQLQDENRELRQRKDAAERLIEVHKKAAVVAFRKVSDELFVAQQGRDWWKEDARRRKEEVEGYGPGLARARAEVRELRDKMGENSRAWDDWKELYCRLEIQLEEAKKAAGNVEVRLEEEKAGLVLKLEVATQGRTKVEEECEALKQSKVVMSDNHIKLQAIAFAAQIRAVSDLKTKLEGVRKDLKVAEKKTQDALLDQSAKLEGALSLQLIEPQALIADLRADVVKLGEEKTTAEQKALDVEAQMFAAKETVREQEVKVTQYLIDIKIAAEKIAALKQHHEQELEVAKTEAEDQIAKLKEQHKEKLDHHMSASADQLEDLTECEKKLTECGKWLTECEKKLTECEKERDQAITEVGELERKRDLMDADSAELHKRWDESREAESQLKATIEAQCDEAVDNVRREVQCKLAEFEVKFLRLERCAIQLQAERITQLASRSANCEPTPSRESSAAADEVKSEENEVKPEGTDVQLQQTNSVEDIGPPTPAHTLSPGPQSPASDISSANGEQKDDEEEPPTPATTWSSDVSSADGDHEDDQLESPTPGQTVSTPPESPENAGSKIKEEYHEDEEIGENINVVQRGVRVLTEVHAQIHGEVSAQVQGELHAQLNAESRKRKRYQLCRTSQPKCNGIFDHMCDTCRGSKRARLPQGIQPDDAIMDGDSTTLGSSPCSITAGSAELINNAVDLAAALVPLDEEPTQSTMLAEKSLQDGLHTTVTNSTTNSPLTPGLVHGSKPPAPTLMTRVLQEVSHSSKGMARRTPNKQVSRTKTRVTKTSERMFVTP
ncbi:hypothetical protein LTR10_000369 [Elasticomyces elasticus]|nr:hypothetical protein LTR10_000369 [Elasticomyces elasticus]KAK4980379.1 hypothetical protein LTR42_000686 [Elasticomyces elasticus]